MAPTPIQNRKYLCQAPRNETWESIRDTVVAGMGDDPASVLETTMDQLRLVHPELKNPRSGPGRKSNAEHALFFYQYLLEYVKNLNGKLPVARHPNPNISSSTIPAIVPPTSSNSYETTTTSSSPICNVCQEDNPYDTTYIPCRTCPRIFHLTCLHPKHADGESYDDWICPYCVLNDPSTPKLRRHPAAAAVRVMARWRKQFARKRAAAAAQEPSLPVIDVDVVAASMKAAETKDTVGDVSKESPEETVAELEDKGDAVALEIRRTSPQGERKEEEPEMKDQTEAEAKMDELEKHREVSAIERRPSSTDRSRRSPEEPEMKEQTEAEAKMDELEKPRGISLIKSGPPSPDRSRRTPEEPEMKEQTEAETKMDELEQIREVSTIESGPSSSDRSRRTPEEPEQKEQTEAEAKMDEVEKPREVSAIESGPSSPNRSRRTRKSPQQKDQTETEAKMDEVEKPRGVSAIESGPSSPDRSRRTRKQPTLYDPQSCAASRWASDELVEWKISTKDESTDDDKSELSQAPLKPQGTNPKSLRQIVLDSGEGFWCNFCRDDPEITLCVFCACRVCFSKHEADQLVCEECGQQYHAKCIGMPAPKGVTSWTCADCVEAKKHAKRIVPSRSKSRDKTPTTAKTAATSQRRSLRAPTPRRVEASSSPTPQQEHLKAAAKKRGTPGRRPVGRPPKNKSTRTVVAPPQQQPAPKKRGRTPSVGGPRKRGRPPKKPREVVVLPEVDHELDGMEVDEKLHHAATHVTRTGRTVKRSTFHDEIEEGAQLQKSSRRFPKAESEQDESSLYFPDDEEYVLPLAPAEQDPKAATKVPVTSPTAAIMPPPPPLPRQEHSGRTPRRKPGARECMQMSRRFGDKVIPQNYYDILMDYCSRGKVEHLIRMRERLDEHSRFLELQLAGLESLVQEHGESDIVVPLMPEKQSDVP